MRDLYITTAGELADFLEKEIAAGRNPSTPEEWAGFMRRLAEAKKAEHLGQTDMTPGYIAGSLRDEGLDVRVLKANKGGENAGG